MRISTQTEAVLAVFLADYSRDLYGLEISKQAGLPSGTLYPILARLEQAGWIESEWEVIDPVRAGRRPRRYYRLTGEGEVGAREALRAAARRIAPVLMPGIGSAGARA
jgi:PadR family transcriptional regulator, regulatory protein PadR